MDRSQREIRSRSTTTSTAINITTINNTSKYNIMKFRRSTDRVGRIVTSISGLKAWWMMAMSLFVVWTSSSSSSMFAVAAPAAPAATFAESSWFERLSTFDVCEQLDETCDTDTETVAEGLCFFAQNETAKQCLAYTDAVMSKVGFVDVTDPSQPAAMGTVDLDGAPTAVRSIDNFRKFISQFRVSIAILYCSKYDTQLRSDGMESNEIESMPAMCSASIGF